MTDEQINKAAEEYADSECLDYFAESLVREAFIKGANFANNHWQEKTRWIPVKERLPEPHTKVLVKFGTDSILIGILNDDKKWALFFSDGINSESECRPITHWREIE